MIRPISDGFYHARVRLLLLLTTRITCGARGCEGVMIRARIYLDSSDRPYVLLIDKARKIRQLSIGIHTRGYPSTSVFRYAHGSGKNITSHRLANLVHAFLKDTCGIHPSYKLHSLRGALATFSLRYVPENGCDPGMGGQGRAAVSVVHSAGWHPLRNAEGRVISRVHLSHP